MYLSLLQPESPGVVHMAKWSLAQDHLEELGPSFSTEGIIHWKERAH